MKCRRSCRYAVSPVSTFFQQIRGYGRYVVALAISVCMSVACIAQNNDAQNHDQQNQTQAEIQLSTVTIPAGTRVALVLTHPIQSRYLHRGDDIYAQVTSPVNSGTEVVIPPGTFVQGTLDKLQHSGERAELRLQSMSITFPDGYVAPISGPVTLETNDGYAIKDPGQQRGVWAFVLPFAGSGLGALIGHSVGSSASTQTTTVPPGCNPAFPNCLSSSMTVPGHKGIDTGIGAVVGGAIGGIASFAALLSSRNFFIDVGAPVEMTLQQSVTLQQNEVAKAVQQSEKHPVAEQPIAPRPMPPPPPDMPTDNGTCWTPGTPGTPPQTIPGPPNPDGTPGPPTTIPGIPATPGTPYPCPN